MHKKQLTTNAAFYLPFAGGICDLSYDKLLDTTILVFMATATGSALDIINIHAFGKGYGLHSRSNGNYPPTTVTVIPLRRTIIYCFYYWYDALPFTRISYGHSGNFHGHILHASWYRGPISCPVTSIASISVAPKCSRKIALLKCFGCTQFYSQYFTQMWSAFPIKQE